MRRAPGRVATNGGEGLAAMKAKLLGLALLLCIFGLWQAMPVSPVVEVYHDLRIGMTYKEAWACVHAKIHQERNVGEYWFDNKPISQRTDWAKVSNSRTWSIRLNWDGEPYRLKLTFSGDNDGEWLAGKDLYSDFWVRLRKRFLGTP